MDDQQALSDLEIVGIAVAAAAALGGLVIGLSRGQDRAEVHPGNGAKAAIPQPDEVAARARRGLEQMREHYPSAREAAKEPLMRARSVLERADVPELRQLRRTRRRGARGVLQGLSPSVGAGLSKIVDRAQAALEQVHVDENELKEVARRPLHLRDSGVFQQLESNIAPVARERSQELLERARGALDEFGARDADPKRRIESVAERGQIAASSVARTSGNAAKETAATVAWLGIASALVYVVLLSPERREQVKSILCGAYEQARLLALDFRGYEPEM